MIYQITSQVNFTSFSHLISHPFRAVIVENSSDINVVIQENLKLGEIINCDAQVMIEMDEIFIYYLTQTPTTTYTSNKHLLTKGLLAAASLSVLGRQNISKNKNSPVREKVVMDNSITVFGDTMQRNVLENTVEANAVVWEGHKSFSETPLDEELHIELCNEWE